MAHPTTVLLLERTELLIMVPPLVRTVPPIMVAHRERMAHLLIMEHRLEHMAPHPMAPRHMDHPPTALLVMEHLNIAHHHRMDHPPTALLLLLNLPCAYQFV